MGERGGSVQTATPAGETELEGIEFTPRIQRWVRRRWLYLLMIRKIQATRNSGVKYPALLPHDSGDTIGLKIWSLMYAIIWVAFIQILIVMFPVLDTFFTYDIHLVIGLVILMFAYTIYRQVKGTECPARIKRITRTTFSLGVFQAVLGLALYALLYFGWSGLVIDFINFLHVVTAIAIITQASSSATAYDMWEEKEFMPAAAAGPTTTTA